MARTKYDDLERIRTDLQNHNFRLTTHALIRMSQRGIAAKDLMLLIRSKALNSPVWNDFHQSWNFTGHGLMVQEFTIACVYEDETLVVTVMR